MGADKSRPIWDRTTEAFRAGDWQEALRQTRALVDADPFAIDARQLLAALYLKVGNFRLALIQYEKLLPLAVGKGDLFRALAIQKHLDAVGSEAARHASRFTAMHKWFRSLGLPGAAVTGSARANGFGSFDLLRLPRDVFTRAAEGAELELLDMQPRSFAVRAGTVWVVVYGRVTWTAELPGGRRSAPQVAHGGQNIYASPDLGSEARIELVPEAPSECLRFESELIRELTRLLPALESSLCVPGEGYTVEERILTPTRPLMPSDLDHRTPGPAVDPKLRAPGIDDDGAIPERPRDSGDWVEFGVVQLPADGVNAEPMAGETGEAGERTIELPHPGSVVRTPRAQRPVVEPPGPVELGDGLIVPPTRDPFAEPHGDVGTPIERRKEPRITVALATRLALLGLAGGRIAPLRGRLTDLSLWGMGIRFSPEDVTPAHAALENAVISVELELGPTEPMLRLAGRVVRLEAEEAGGLSLGVELVLATELDRTRLREAVEAAAR